MLVADNEVARATLFEHVQTLESDPNFGEPTLQMVADYGEMLDQRMRESHQTDRGSQQLSVALDMPRNRFEGLFARKSVLDVGCGEGVLDRQLATNKKTLITALDHNPKVLAKIPPRPNLRTVEGSGDDLQAAVGDEEFDVVFVAFSTLTWARTAVQARRGIESALAACKVGGMAIFIPLIQHPQSHEAYKAALAKGNVPGYADGQVDPAGIEFAINCVRMEDWMRSTKLRTFEAAENSGRIACSYVASALNRRRLSLNSRLGLNHPRYEDYSLVATVLEK